MDLEYAQKRKRPPARLLIAVDGVVYDVTKFAERHPGGLGPLHRHCGSLGSSAAFHSVGHSETAQLLMREFAVGMLPPGTGSETMEERKERIETALRDERIARTAQPYAPMSNAGWDECAPGSSEYFSLSFGGLLVSTWMLLHPLPALVSPPPAPSDAASAAGGPGIGAMSIESLHLPEWSIALWMLAAWGHMLDRDSLVTNSAYNRYGNTRKPLRSNLLATLLSPTCHLHAIVGVSMLLATLAIVSQTGRAATLLAASQCLVPLGVSAARSQLVTTRGACAVALALVSLCSLLPYAAPRLPTPPLSATLLAPLAPAWAAAAAAAVGDAARPFGGANALLATILALVTLLQTALAARQVRVLPKGCKALHVYLAAAYLSMLVVLLGADGGRARSASPLTSPLVAASSLMHELQSLADGLWLLGLVSALVAAFGVLSPWHDGVVPWTTDAELRVITVGSLALVLAISRGELSNGQALLGVLGLLAHMNRLTLEAMGSLSRGLHSKCEREQHAWIGVALDLSTQVRYLVATTVFAVGNLLVQIADMLVPRPAKFYCHPTPCAYHGEGVEMGVAYFVYPGGGSRQQLAKKGREAPHSRKPTTFVCNVGHMMREHDNRDWLRLGHSTIKMSDSLKSDDAAKQGFCGQYLAEFPADHGSVRQLNLTAWVDDHSAHDWYVNNEEHKQVVDNYRNGLLASFSSMLARLHHAGNSGAKFHVRCLYCRALLTNYPEQRFCRECGWEAHYMPLF